MKKKYGPLPLWAWGAVGVVAVYLWYRYSQSSSSATTAATTSSDGIDPATGISYADEEAAYQNEAASALSPGSGGSSDGGGGDGTTTPDLGQELSDVTGFITDLENAGLVSAPGSNSNGSSAAGTNQSAPVTTPQVNNRISTGHLLTPKAIQAPAGSSAPPPKNGYTVVGTGSGNYQYVPDSLVTAAGGYISSKISRTAPKVGPGQTAKGLGNGLWEVIPKPKPRSKTLTVNQKERR